MRPIDESFVRRILGNARIERWNVPVTDLADALARSVDKAFANRTPSESDVERHVRALHLDDLVLACACAAGNEAAWEHFVLEHRPALYRAAEAIDHSGRARELADSLYAELFGLQEREGRRQSLFRYFHGRSSLNTWLRAVLAQRFVDGVRVEQRFEPLPDDDISPLSPAPAAAPADPDRTRWLTLMHGALAASLAALPPRDRLRLACYYAQEMTLAQIGAMLREHEATVSRHLSRTRRMLRDRIEVWLRREGQLGPREVEQCLTSVMSDPGPLDLGHWLDDKPDRKERPLDRSTTESPS